MEEKQMTNKYNKKCCICDNTQSEKAKTTEGGMFIAVFPTDADKKLNGEPQTLFKRCFHNFFSIHS